MKKIGRILGIVVVVAILLSEFYLRMFYYEQLKTRKTSTHNIPDSLKVFKREPNVIETYITPEVNNSYKINNMGYVGPDFNVKKTPGVFRIIVVGNSEAVGMQAKGGRNYCEVLQKIFDQNNMKIEVINCAREGSEKDFQNLYIIKTEIIKYQPDLVLLENTGMLHYRRYVYEGYRNYSLEYDPLKPETRAECVKIVDNLYKHWYLTRLYDVSYIIRAICKRYVDKHSNWNVKLLYSRNSKKFEKYLYSYIKKDAKVSVPSYFLTWSYASTEINKVISSLDSIGSRLVLFTYGNYSKPLKCFLKENNINIIQLKMGYYYNYLTLNSKLEGHTNEIGHALIAERLFSQMIINNYIPKNIQQNDTENK